MRFESISNYRKRSISDFLLAFIIACLALLADGLLAAPAIIPRPPEIAATSYILIDALTGQIIVEENADEPLPPASLTKIMTAYICLLYTSDAADE